MTPDLLYFDDLDAATTYGFSCTALPSVFAAPDTAWDGLAVPFRPGLLLRNDEPQVAPRVLAIEGLIRGTDASDAVAKLDTLKAALLGQTVRVRFGAVLGVPAGREYVSVVQAIDGSPFAGGQITEYIAVTIACLVPDAAARDATETVVATSPPSLTPVQVGTAPTFPVVTLAGPGVNPVVTLTDGFGFVATQMAFGVTLGVADSLVIDCAEGGSVTYLPGGVPEQGLGFITNEDYAFPVGTPAMINPVGPNFPAISVSGGGSLTVRYRRRYY